jgi:hypothetical protein
MLRALLKNGVIYPLEPLPSNWKDGKELRIMEVFEEIPNDPEAIDKVFGVMEETVQTVDPAVQGNLG